jgi:hypothetical protein
MFEIQCPCHKNCCLLVCNACLGGDSDAQDHHLLCYFASFQERSITLRLQDDRPPASSSTSRRPYGSEALDTKARSSCGSLVRRNLITSFYRCLLNVTEECLSLTSELLEHTEGIRDTTGKFLSLVLTDPLKMRSCASGLERMSQEGRTDLFLGYVRRNFY